MRPLESMRCEAKMVLMRVDFPSPVWPVTLGQRHSSCSWNYRLTDADDVELEASLEQLLFDLLGNAIKSNMASGKDSIPLWHRHCHLGK